jgi:glyoxylase-like metal-dependent hydrolase (beta-lactamase superfamily II)
LANQIKLEPENRAYTNGDGGMQSLGGDLAYMRLSIVNVVFVGMAGAGDRNWVLVDTGLVTSRAAIERAAERRFGSSARPAAIILTHGHFDHVGSAEVLAQDWDVPVYAHPLEHPFLDGSASYPPADPWVGGGL